MAPHRSTGGASDRGGGGLAPVTPLFGARTSGDALPAADGTPLADRTRLADRVPARSADVPRSRTASWHTTWTDSAESATDIDDVDDAPDAAEQSAAAESVLLRKLRTRSLSVKEARAVLLACDLDASSVEAIVERCEGLGYLDDAKLAEQLIYTGSTRKGQGRMMLSQTLSKRGIPREVIDAAFDEMPDDERERALEFARSKARTLRGVDREVALRRLSGQLARRGYGAHALDAARVALDELARPARASVRFEPLNE